MWPPVVSGQPDFDFDGWPPVLRRSYEYPLNEAKKKKQTEKYTWFVRKLSPHATLQSKYTILIVHQLQLTLYIVLLTAFEAIRLCLVEKPIIQSSAIFKP
jgi:hypothetical protein